jgi:acyl-coenzyme A thioesterase PaaI-like protein
MSGYSKNKKGIAMNDNYLLKLYHKFESIPFGKLIFAFMFARKAPYFSTISPRIQTLRPNFCELTFAKRRKVENHIGTVHVIAICNGMEMAMGALAEVCR